ncbi:hypothetical protein VIOLET_84 [Mycobacterium phage Violet]|uniref:DUF7435 domain-containing protein n=1 Tax=Mycobacterium phage Violet TaxID=1086800 RepID=G3MER9_9CAUD|nr:hypothetical protein VIOLET_84 [Mycobacterium phage Violet]AEO94533.1 hypothetical protein VIOLET_84 [Mycobacterium phage Violet]
MYPVREVSRNGDLTVVGNPLGWRFVLDGDLAAVREHVDSRG